MKRWGLLLHTVRYLKLRQLFYQIYYRVCKPRFKPQHEPVLRGAMSGRPFASFLEPATDDGETFEFLGQIALFKGNWNDSSFPKLWLYNLHYQDDLSAKGAELRPEFCERLVDAWISGNPGLQGNGWEPYCLSLRLVNWVKYFSRLKPEQVKPEWLRSLASQTDALEQQLEFHILGNHLFANAKAFVFVGSFLGGEQGVHWLRRGLKLLDEEVREQFLEDGAHFELSPMYHATLLWDLADLLALGAASRLPELDQPAKVWEAKFIKGFEWLQAMIHPNGEIAFFNDAALGIAPTRKDLQAYAAQLGIALSPDPLPRKLQSKRLQSSGYAVIDWLGGHRLLADVARIGPDYQPGHAHADTLSFELSLFGQRILVNSGISQYGDDAERRRQRSTSAHNTVEVDGENSSEVWAGFRVARRAKPFNIDLQENDGQICLQASHDGYKRLPGKVVHHRRWLATDQSLQIQDELDGHFQQAVAHFHFHPDVIVAPDGKYRFKVRTPDGRSMMLEVDGGNARLVNSKWHPHFGVSVSNQKLLAEFTGSKLNTRITWSSF